MSTAPAPAIPAGEHWVSEDDLEPFFIAALLSAGRGYVRLEQWERFVRQPDGALEKVWDWHLFLSGDVYGYAPRELVLDLAAPLLPGSADADALERRGRLARLLGIGQAEPVADNGVAGRAAVEEPEETKVIDLPVVHSGPPPGIPANPDLLSPNDPNLFPG